MSVAIVNWEFDQGTTVRQQFTYQVPSGSNFDWTGYSCTAKAKVNATDGSPAFTFSGSFNGTRTDGVFFLNMTAASSSLPSAGQYLYDVMMSNGTQTIRPIAGTVTVNATISL